MPTKADQIAALLEAGKNLDEAGAAVGSSREYARAVRSRRNMTQPLLKYRRQVALDSLRKVRERIETLRHLQRRLKDTGKSHFHVGRTLAALKKRRELLKAKVNQGGARPYCKVRRPTRADVDATPDA